MTRKQTKKLANKLLAEQKERPKSLFKDTDRVIFSETVSEKKLKEILPVVKDKLKDELVSIFKMSNSFSNRHSKSF